MEQNEVKLTVDTENLAVPEVHTGKVKQEEEETVKEKKKINIQFDNLAVPEIHIKK